MRTGTIVNVHDERIAMRFFPEDKYMSEKNRTPVIKELMIRRKITLWVTFFVTKVFIME